MRIRDVMVAAILCGIGAAGLGWALFLAPVVSP